MHFEQVTTGDGSKTLYLPHLDETYHSVHGALRESMHVYIESGFRHLIDSNDLRKIKIFEMGFGTGLNAFLTAHFSQVLKTKVYYRSIEKYPIDERYHQELEYFDIKLSEVYRSESEAIVQANWGERTKINEYFEIEKVCDDFMLYANDSTLFDIIYYDAFGHRAQSSLWELEPFNSCYHLLRKGGLLVTYASKGSARRNLISAGFEVEKIPGPPGKREMMRAKKI